MKLHTSYRHCRNITKQKIPSVYLATRVLKRQTKLHIWALSAFYKYAEDIAFDNSISPSEKVNKIDQIRQILKKRQYDSSDLLWPAVLSTIEVCDIPIEYIEQHLDGRAIEAKLSQMLTREDLVHYCDLIGGSAGMIFITALGSKKPKAIQSVRNLGIAMQLTNILRFVGRDQGFGRIYLPVSDLKQFDVKKGDIEAGRITNEFIDLLKDYKSLALGFYHDARDGMKFLPSKSQRLVRTIMRLNIGILRRIEENDFNVYNETARLSWLEKAIIILNTK